MLGNSFASAQICLFFTVCHEGSIHEVNDCQAVLKSPREYIKIYDDIGVYTVQNIFLVQQSRSEINLEPGSLMTKSFPCI